MNKELIEEFKSILIPAEFYTDKVYTELSLSKEESMTILKYINNLEEQNNKYKNALDKIKEYCNHKLEMLELQKRNIMQILTPENGYLKADIEIEMQKYKDILELLEEIE